MDTPRDNLRTSPGLEDLDLELDAPLLPRRLPGSPAAPEDGGGGLLRAAHEARRILGIGAPLVVEELLSYSSTVLSLGFAGRLGPAALSAFTLSHAVTNISGIALTNGITCSIDTFSSQAHGGAHFAAIGATLQKGLALSLAACAPLMALYCCWIGPLLLVLGQEARLAAAAARYIRLFSATIPLHAVALCCYRTLAAQGAAGHLLAAGAAFFAATPILNWLLIFRLGLGLDGSALAAVACEVVNVTALVAACWVHNAARPPERRWWHGWSAAAMAHGWRPFLRLSLAATLMITLDWWVYDMLTLLAGRLPAPEVPVAASGLLYYIQSLVFMVPLGLSFSVSCRVGAHLGAGDPRSAQLSAEAGTGLGLLLVGAPVALLLAAPRPAAALFTRDPAVIDVCVALMPALAVLIVANAASALLSGSLRGSGRQQRGALVNGTINYCVGLPLMILLARRHGVYGLWWGLAAAAALQAGVLAALIRRLDWRRETLRAGRLVGHLSKTSLLSASRSSSRRGTAGEEAAEAAAYEPATPVAALLPPLGGG